MFDVFLSYNSQDRAQVEMIAVHLDDKAKLKPWFDQWRLVAGKPWMSDLEKGLEESLSCAVFIGPAGQSPGQQREVEAAIQRQMRDKEFRIIPVLLPGVAAAPKMSSFLPAFHWVDFRNGLDDDTALWRLECGIRGESPGPGRTRPPQQQDAATNTSPPIVAPLRLDVTRAERPVNVFVSYRHSEPDNTLAHTFADALKQAGHEVFIDTGIRWGSDWVKGIREALERSDYLLLLLSRDSGASEMVVREVALARELARQRKGRPVILPIRLGFPFTEPLPYQLAVNLHDIHQEVWHEPADTMRLARRLLATVTAEANWQTDAPKAPEAVKPAHRLQPQFDPRSLLIPGGAVEADSRFYIIREADDEVFTELQKTRATVTVRAPRQTGKTSLIMSMYVALRRAEQPFRTAFIDFQALEEKAFQSRNAIWCAIAAQVAKQLQLTGWRAADWQFDDSYDSNISAFLDKHVFTQAETPLLLCLDEVDRVFSSAISAKFFGSVRAFFNRGAFDQSWKQVRWLLGSSSEPSFFIKDLTQSPFNIGLRVELDAFTPAEIETFAGRHGLILTPQVLTNVLEFVGGRPYLIHLMFYHMARNSSACANLFDTQACSRTVFRDHLHSYLVQFQREAALAAAMKTIINGGSADPQLVERLEAAGLVRHDDTLRPVPACRLYAEFFASQLS